MLAAVSTVIVARLTRTTMLEVGKSDFVRTAKAKGLSDGQITRLQVRKSQSCYGWNISPRMVTIGIWKPVSFLLVDGAEIADVFVSTTSLKDGTAELEALVELKHNHGAPGTVGLSQDGVFVKQGEPCDFKCWFKAEGLRQPVRVRLHHGARLDEAVAAVVQREHAVGKEVVVAATDVEVLREQFGDFRIGAR